MILQGKITLQNYKDDSVIIEIEDDNSITTFLKVDISNENFIKFITRKQGSVGCELNFKGLDRVGKIHENKTFECKLPVDFDRFNKESKKLLHKHVQSHLTDGWIADNYFSKQDTFFNKDGENWVRCTIRRWI